MGNFFPPRVSAVPVHAGKERMHWCYKELKDDQGLVVYEYGNYAYENTLMSICDKLGITPSTHFVYLNYNINKALKIVLNVVKRGSLVINDKDIRSAVSVQAPLLRHDQNVEIVCRVQLEDRSIVRVTISVPPESVDYEEI